MSPNNPFGLQERSMGLLEGMQQSANQAVMPQSPPTQYVEPGPVQAPAYGDPFTVYRKSAGTFYDDGSVNTPSWTHEATFDPSLPGGGITPDIKKPPGHGGAPSWRGNEADWTFTLTPDQEAQSYANAVQFQKMSGLFGS